MPSARPLPFAMGRYQCHKYLGGNVSEVYQATDTASGAETALKLIHTGGEDGDIFRRRFLAETQIAGRVSHPNIVSTVDAGEAGGTFFLVMELLQGETLGEYLRRGGLERQDQAIGFAWQIARALAHVHDLGIVHRDLKPENIMIEAGGRIKLFDFGVARVADQSITRAGELVGTPLYMSPEQVRGKPINRSADIYSFGVLFFLLLTGTFPYRASNREELFDAIVNRPPDLEPLHGANAPPHVATCVARCLEKNFALRPKSFHEIAHVLRPHAPEYVTGNAALTQVPVKDPSWLNTPIEIPIPARPAAAAATATVPQPAAAAAPALAQPTPVAAPAPEAPPAGSAASANRKLAGGVLLLLSCAVFVIGGGAFVLRYLRTRDLNNPISAVMPSSAGGGNASSPAASAMVFVPAGRALLGKDRHAIDVAAFYIDKTEVSNRNYLAFCKETKRPSPPGSESAPPEFPVVQISFEDASEYAKWIGRRLPTAVEWEKAARGDKGDEFPWGNQPRLNLANIGGEPNRRLSAVTSYFVGASPYGALNMAGNAWEWLDAKEEVTEADWQRLRNRVNPPLERSESGRQIRGGSYLHKVAVEELGSVIWDFAVAPARLRREDIGFRCVKDGPP